MCSVGSSLNYGRKVWDMFVIHHGLTMWHTEWFPPLCVENAFKWSFLGKWDATVDYSANMVHTFVSTDAKTRCLLFPKKCPRKIHYKTQWGNVVFARFFFDTFILKMRHKKWDSYFRILFSPLSSMKMLPILVHFSSCASK